MGGGNGFSMRAWGRRGRRVDGGGDTVEYDGVERMCFLDLDCCDILLTFARPPKFAHPHNNISHLKFTL